MRFSIIVPVYNAKPWVQQCVEAVAAQNEGGELCEMLLVDDGSTDGSAAVCRQMAERYPWVHCFSESNSGPATARNLGMDHAQGEYLWFVDADDQIAPDALQALSRCIEANNHPDAICFNYRYVHADSHADVADFTTEATIAPAIDIALTRVKIFAWNRIHRREAIAGVRWPDGLINTEDYYFSLTALTRIKSLVTLPQVLYYYNCTNPNSTLRTRNVRNVVRNRNHTLEIHRRLVADIARCTNAHTRQVLESSLGVTISGQLFCALHDHTPHFVHRTIAEYRRLEVYPVGKTHNAKANAFLRIANHEWLLLTALRLRQLLNIISHRFHFLVSHRSHR